MLQGSLGARAGELDYQPDRQELERKAMAHEDQGCPPDIFKAARTGHVRADKPTSAAAVTTAETMIATTAEHSCWQAPRSRQGLFAAKATTKRSQRRVGLTDRNVLVVRRDKRIATLVLLRLRSHYDPSVFNRLLCFTSTPTQPLRSARAS